MHPAGDLVLYYSYNSLMRGRHGECINRLTLTYIIHILYIRQWLPCDKIRLLGEDKGKVFLVYSIDKLLILLYLFLDWDAIMLSGTNTKIQKFRTTKIKEQCRAAWRLENSCTCGNNGTNTAFMFLFLCLFDRTAMAELETNTPEGSGVGVSEITPVDEPDKVPKIES